MRNWAAAEGSEEPAPSAAAALTPGRRCSCGLGWAEPAAASPPPWQPAAPRRQRPASRPAQRPVTRDSRLGPGPARRCGRAGGHGPPRPRPAAADPPGAGGPRGALRTGGGARGLRRERGGAPALVPPPTGGARETLPRLGAPLHPQRGMKCPLRVSWPIPTLPLPGAAFWKLLKGGGCFPLVRGWPPRIFIHPSISIVFRPNRDCHA